MFKLIVTYVSARTFIDTIELFKNVDTLKKRELIGNRWLVKPDLLYAYCFIFAPKKTSSYLY